MKKFLFFILVVMVCTPAWADDEFVFRKVKWGMTVEEVKKSEDGQSDSKFLRIEKFLNPDRVTNPSQQENVTSTFKVQMFDTTAGVSYFFSSDSLKLENILVTFSAPCLNRPNIEACLQSLNFMLETKYGKPQDMKESLFAGGRNVSLWWDVPDKVIMTAILPFDTKDRTFDVIGLAYFPANLRERLQSDFQRNLNNL